MEIIARLGRISFELHTLQSGENELGIIGEKSFLGVLESSFSRSGILESDFDEVLQVFCAVVIVENLSGLGENRAKSVPDPLSSIAEAANPDLVPREEV